MKTAAHDKTPVDDLTQRLPRLSLRRALAALAALAVAALLARTMLGGDNGIGHAAGLVSHPAAGWLVAAVFFEVLAYVAYAAAQQRLVRSVGRRLSVRWLASLALAAQALINFLPAGYIACNVLNFRELRRRELSAAESAWVLLVTSMLYVGALALLAIVGSEVAGSGSGAAAADVRLAAYVALGVVLSAGAAALLLARRGQLGRLVDRVLARFGQHSIRSQLSAIRLPKRRAAAASALFLTGWLADAACLVAAFFAVGGSPPWEGFLMAYAAAQLVAFMPITPGGLGFMEGSLTVMLVAAGGAHAHVLAAVLLYRMITYWGALPAGLAGYLVLRRSAPPQPEPALALAPAPGS